jgi:hypothetical protein
MPARVCEPHTASLTLRASPCVPLGPVEDTAIQRVQEPLPQEWAEAIVRTVEQAREFGRLVQRVQRAEQGRRWHLTYDASVRANSESDEK